MPGQKRASDPLLLRIKPMPVCKSSKCSLVWAISPSSFCFCSLKCTARLRSYIFCVPSEQEVTHWAKYSPISLSSESELSHSWHLQLCVAVVTLLCQNRVVRQWPWWPCRLTGSNPFLTCFPFSCFLIHSVQSPWFYELVLFESCFQIVLFKL